ncbi:hypothetical protein V8F33_007667 [Rhypophila sp. PSN 637]
MAATTTLISVTVGYGTWLPSTVGQPLITFVGWTCPSAGINSTANPGGLFGVNMNTVGVPQGGLTTSTYTPSGTPAGAYVPYDCSYTVTVQQSPIPTSTATSTAEDPASPKTTLKKTTTKEVSSATPTQTPSTDKSGPNISTAELSGIGIGALVLGILLGVAAAGCLICCRRRRSKKGRMPHADERSAMLLSAPPVPPPKDPAMNSPSSQTQSSPRVTPTSAAAVMPPTSSLVGQANVLHSSEGASDDSIAEELIYLGNLIEEHVKNNYHLNSLNINHSVLRDSLDGLNLDDAMRNHIAVLALAPHYRHVAIRHFLALTIFSALDVHYAHGLSLLPPGVAAFMQSLPCDKPEDYQYSLDTWRRASAYLLNNNIDKSIPLTPPESPNTQIECFHAAVNRFLSHFVHENSRAVFDQTKNLEGVIYECAVFGYSIFSHPCLWRYTYIHQQHQSTSSDLEKSSLVVLPGLEKLTRRGGEVLAHPDVLVAPSVVSV